MNSTTRTSPAKSLAPVAPQSALVSLADADRNTVRVVESLVMRGDISGLSPEERTTYYLQVCKAYGLNPASNPFAFLRLNGKEIMYATKVATDQLAAIHRVNREIVEGPKVIDLAGTKLVYAMCRATLPNGRVETAVATVPLTDPVNVLMKAETKCKRRATLSILGLALLDESELETIPANVKAPSAMPPMASIAPGGVEIEADGESVSPAMQRVYDDVRQFADEEGRVALALEQAEGIVDSHYAALAAESNDSVAEAMRYLKEQLAPGLRVRLGAVFAKYGQRLADQRRAAHEAKQCAPGADESPERQASSAPTEVSGDTLFPAICAAQSLEALVAAWMARREVIAGWEPEDVFNARGDAVAHLNTILGGTDEAGAAKLFDDAVAAAKKGPRGPNDEGPKPGRRVRPVSAGADANGSAAEGASGAGATARAPHPESEPYAFDPDLWLKHVRSWASAYAVINGWAKHAPAFRAAGNRGSRMRVAAGCLAAIRGCDEDTAETTLANAEKAADHEAQFKTPESRRQKRNTDEKGPRSLPEMVATGRAAVG